MAKWGILTDDSFDKNDSLSICRVRGEAGHQDDCPYGSIQSYDD